MRTTLKVFAAIVVATIASSTADLSAQEIQTEESVQDCVCIVGGAPVLNAPFTAVATLIWTPAASTGRSEVSALARYYRDSAGRVRVEQAFIGDSHTPRRIIVTPEADGTVYQLDPDEKKAAVLPRVLAKWIVGERDRYVLARSMNQFISFFQRALDTESLGQRSMAGVPATGTSFSSQVPAAGRGERWEAPDLSLVVYYRVQSPTIGLITYTLTKISRGEPDARLFEVPEDYALMAPEYPFTWENAYATRTPPPD
jgi:hypothetical protein